MHIDDSEPYVFKIVDGRIKRQNIQFSLQNLTRVEITSGLSEGDQVALPAEEMKPLSDSASVKVVP
jgi:HlyD family secretion protein